MDKQTPPKQASQPSKLTPPKVVQFHDLAEGQNEIRIEFQGQSYTLRVTRNGKLILNK